VQPCAAATPLRAFQVNLVAPAFQVPSSVTVQIGYRSNLVSLPGSGTAPAARIRSRPSGATVTPNDLDYALRVVVSRAGGLSAARLFIVDLDSCSGAATPTTADFSCEVGGCSSSNGPIDGCTCTVVSP
jgi:hypothetical protein